MAAANVFESPPEEAQEAAKKEEAKAETAKKEEPKAKATSHVVMVSFGCILITGVIAIASLGVVIDVRGKISELSAKTVVQKVDVAKTKKTTLFSPDDNYCAKAKPTVADFDNIDCVTAGVEQAGGDVTLNYKGGFDTTKEPIKTPYFKAGLCPVNVHWHLGAEHRSKGEFDENGKGPDSSRRLRGEPLTTPSGRKLAGKVRLGGRCHHYDSSDSKFTTEYDWKHCVDMHVGETYEVHWPHSAMGACGTPHQYQTPFYDGVFCNLNETTAKAVGSKAEGNVALTSTNKQIGVQGQVFTIVNDESYYFPDLIKGMIVDGVRGTKITAYTGSTTGTSRNNKICSRYAPITWHVDRKCHLISASSFDKMCADMASQVDDMSGDFYAHGSREVVSNTYTADNQQDISSAYAHPTN